MFWQFCPKVNIWPKIFLPKKWTRPTKKWAINKLISLINDLPPRQSQFLIHYFVKIFFLITYLFLFSFTWNGPKFFKVRNYNSESLSKVDSKNACIFAHYLKREQNKKREWANFFLKIDKSNAIVDQKSCHTRTCCRYNVVQY